MQALLASVEFLDPEVNKASFFFFFLQHLYSFMTFCFDTCILFSLSVLTHCLHLYSVIASLYLHVFYTCVITFYAYAFYTCIMSQVSAPALITPIFSYHFLYLTLVLYHHFLFLCYFTPVFYHFLFLCYFTPVFCYHFLFLCYFTPVFCYHFLYLFYFHTCIL